jgi:hypothetical protein
MSERETKEFTTPQGHKLVLKTYLTARELMPITDDKDLKDSAKTHKLAEAGIVSLGGDTQNIGERMLDLPVTEYTAIVKELTGLVSDLTGTK